MTTLLGPGELWEALREKGTPDEGSSGIIHGWQEKETT
jgi:hypothetical protein